MTASRELQVVLALALLLSAEARCSVNFVGVTCYLACLEIVRGFEFFNEKRLYADLAYASRSVRVFQVAFQLLVIARFTQNVGQVYGLV